MRIHIGEMGLKDVTGGEMQPIFFYLTMYLSQDDYQKRTGKNVNVLGL
jgi:hypothetical protein